MQIDNKKKIVISIILIIVLIVFIIYTIMNNQYEEINLDDLVYENLSDEHNDMNNVENESQNNEIVDEDGDKEEEQIIVHVTGEVKKEGIVYLEKGARVIDAIEKAGGETKEADLSQINLAYELQDGQKIYVPNKDEKISEYIIGGIGNNDLVEENSNRKGEESEY